MRNVKCSYCEEYRNEWCEKIIDSPHPDILRDCQYYHEAKTRWIPCSERQPTEDGEYITTVEDGEGMFVTSNDWRQDWKEWGFLSYYGESDEPTWRRVTNVVAWMPLPEPHKNKEGQG